jgi:hypothetical protein
MLGPRHKGRLLHPLFANEPEQGLLVPGVTHLSEGRSGKGCITSYLHQVVFGLFLQQLVARNNCRLR